MPFEKNNLENFQLYIYTLLYTLLHSQEYFIPWERFYDINR